MTPGREFHIDCDVTVEKEGLKRINFGNWVNARPDSYQADLLASR